jgi:hypothetical protein
MVSLFAKKSLFSQVVCFFKVLKRASPFCLDTKSNQKNQDNKDASLAPCRFFTLFSLFGTFVPHITQKAKPPFPPLRWPALVVRAHAFLFPVSRTASGESR